MLHLGHSFVLCWNLDTLESRSGITESFEMWRRRRMEKISWMGGVKMKKCYSLGGKVYSVYKWKIEG